MKIISIANQKGGCGKTTTAINLASALSQNGQRVLLLDLDPQAHASLGLDIESQDSIYNVISKLTPRKLKIENIVQRVEDSFDLVPSNVLVGTLEQELSDEIGRELKLREVIEPLKGAYDYIIIDCPPSLGILTVNAIRVSDEIIVPVETSRFSMQGVDHLMDIVNLVKDRLNHEVKCRILVTMFDSRLRHSFSMLSTFKERFEEILFDTIIHINVKLKESAVMGKTVSTYDKYCRGSKDYFSLAKELLLIEKQELEAEDRAEEASPVAPEIPKSVSADIADLEKSLSAVVEEETLAEETELEERLSGGTMAPMSEQMQEIVRQEINGITSVRFSIEAPEAKSVYVTGSFNDWSLDDTCRMREQDGIWEAEISLKPGLYKYQFIVDGVWKEDPRNNRKERNSFGDINSLIEVKAGDGQNAN
ncbi:MAG: AAA family ATPase [Candidatus Omnitrophica bacterium]|nr:AAA family ATPase [Candidatus Omnitrophota bacterium]